MARIETSTNLVGKSITLLDGTKAKIVDAIASGYKVDKRTARVPTRCVVKKGAGFAEIERMSMTQLHDTGEGYVELKAAGKTATKPAAKTAAKTTSKKVTAKTPAKTAGKTSAKAKVKTKPEPVAEPRTRVRRKKPSAAEPIVLREVNEEFTSALAERLFDHLKDNDLLKFDADNVTPISNAVDVKYSAEFATPNMIHITFGIEYALPEEEAAEEEQVALDDAVVARAAKKVGSKVGKKLVAAIKKAYGLSVDDFLPGTVLDLSGAQFIYCGPSATDVDTAYLYSADTDKFRPVTSLNLSKYALVADEEPEDDEDEDEEEEADDEEPDADIDFDDEEEEEEAEEEEEEEAAGDDAEYSYLSVTKQHLAEINKNVSAKYHDKMADMWGIDADVLVPGLILTDGDTTFAYVGFNNKGGLVVIDVEDGEIMIYKKADIDTLTEFAAVLDNDDAAEEEDGDDEEAADDEEEAEGDDDFDFDDDAGEDFSDLSHDELIDKAVELGLAKPRKAAAMSEEDLRELLSA